jgi:hypothetical protein
MNTEYHWNSSSYEPHVEVASELKEIGFKIVLIYSLEVAKNEFECEQDSFKDEEQFYIKKTFELIDKIINNNSFSDEDKTNLENCSFFVKDLFKNLTTSSSFDWLLIAHLFGDYVSQTTSEAKGKDKGGILNKYLLLHCLKYTLVCGFVLFLYHISLYWLVLIFTSHMVLDYRKFLIWFRRSIKRSIIAVFF